MESPVLTVRYLKTLKKEYVSVRYENRLYSINFSLFNKDSLRLFLADITASINFDDFNSVENFSSCNDLYSFNSFDNSVFFEKLSLSIFKALEFLFNIVSLATCLTNNSNIKPVFLTLECFNFFMKTRPISALVLNKYTGFYKSYHLSIK